MSESTCHAAESRMRVTVIFLLAILAGCAGVTPSSRLAEVQPGMSQAQVVAILGEPKSVSGRPGGITFLRYELSGRRTALLDRNSPMFADGYIVQLQDGKVVAYGREDEFRGLNITVLDNP